MAREKKKSRAEATANPIQEKYNKIRKQMQRETHVRDVLDYLYKNGTITNYQAFEFLNNTRLSSSIFSLRHTYDVPVVMNMVEKNGKQYGMYWIDWEVLDV